MGVFEQRTFLAVAAVCTVLMILLVVHLVKKQGGRIKKGKARKKHVRREAAYTPVVIPKGGALCAIAGLICGAAVVRSVMDRH